MTCNFVSPAKQISDHHNSNFLEREREREMEAKTNEDETPERKTRVLIRAVKSANFISSLYNRLLNSTLILKQQEEEMKLRRENEDLKTKLVLERVKNRKIKLCGLTEFVLMIVVCFGLWLFCLFVLFGFF